jgi:benzodiazapine receptor
MRDWKSLIIFLALTAIVAALGSMWMPDAWYDALRKPSFNPPGWLFAPVWTVLYVLIAIAGWRVYRIAGWSRPIQLWLVQLILNGLWTPLFFGAHRIDLALVDIVLLVLLVIATIAAFWRIDRIAAYLMIPYLAWISFATLLTASIWQLNH